MKAQEKLSYGIIRTVETDFDKTVERMREALNEEGFGILTEIRIDEKLKEKLGVDFRRYVILGACNPALAHETLQNDINIGLLLPCNVIVYESEEPGKSVVGAIDADTMMSVVADTGEIGATAKKVNRLLGNAIASI